MAKYQFESVSMTIEKKKYTLQYADIKKSFRNIDRHILTRLPPSARHRIMDMLEQAEGGLVTPELERICERYGIPVHFLLRELDQFEPSSSKKSEPFRQALDGIRKSLNAQLLYLPTYRRIEQELSLIFKDMDERELRTRGKFLSDQKKEGTFVELIEFGMKDVDEAINETRKELDSFARESLNNLTFGYLGDIVEHKYASVDLKKIKSATAETVENILNRIGSSRNRVGKFHVFQSAGSMDVSIFSRRYSSSRRPYARRWMTRILLLSPSTKPSETLFSGLQ